MTFWDSFKDTIGNIVGAAGDIATSTAKSIIGGAAQAGVTQQVARTGAGASAVRQAQRAVETTPMVEGAATQGASGLLISLDVPYQQTTVKGVLGTIGRFAGIPESARKQVSPGQATVAAIGKILPGKQGVDKIDWTSKKQVDEFFGPWGAPKVISGVVDGAWRILDPTFLTFGAAKIATNKTLTRPIVGKVDDAVKQIEVQSKEIDAAVAGLKSPAKPLIDRIMTGYGSRAELLSGESIVYKSNNPSDLATALWQAREYGREAVGDVLKIGIGNEDALRKVSDSYDALTKVVKDVQEESDFFRQQLLEPINKKQPYWSTAEAESIIAQNKSFLEQAAKENAYLERILSGNEQLDIPTYNPSTTVSSIRSSIRTQTWAKYEALEQARGKVNLRRAKSYWDNENIVTSGGKAVRVLNWVDESSLKKQIPSGHVALNQRGVADTYSEVIASVRQAQAQGGLSPQWADERVSQWMMLDNKLARDQWLENFEKESLFAIFRNKLDITDLNDKQLNALRVLSDSLIRTHRTLRRRANQQMASNNFMVIDDTGDVVIAEGMKQFIKKYADDFDVSLATAKSRLVDKPSLESQIPDFYQMVDFELYSRIIDENPIRFQNVVNELRRTPDPTKSFTDRLANLEASIVGEVQPITPKKVISGTTDVLDYAVDAFNAVWKPTVLARLGYPIRNVLEGAGRMVGYNVEATMSMGWTYTKDTLKGMGGYYAKIPKYGVKYVDTLVKRQIGKRNLKISEGELRTSILTDDELLAKSTSTFNALERSVKAETAVLHRLNKTKIKDIRTALKNSQIEITKDIDSFITKLEKYLTEEPDSVFDIKRSDELIQTLVNSDKLKQSLDVIKFWKSNSLDEAKMIEDFLDNLKNPKANAWDRIIEKNPEMATNNKKDMALVKTSFLKPLREFDRAGADAQPYSRRTIDAIRADFRSGKGLENPIWVDYTFDENDNLYLFVSEGNHRLVAAIEEGIEEVPVALYRGSVQELSEKWNRFKKIGPAPKLKPKNTPDRYFPATANPLDVLPNKAFIPPVMKDNIFKTFAPESFQMSPVELQGVVNIMNLRLEQARILTNLEVLATARAAKVGKLDRLIGAANVERIYNASGKVKVFDDVEMDDAFGGWMADIARGDVTAMNTVQQIFIDSNRGALNSLIKTKATRENIAPDNPEWGRSWAEFLNNQVRNDKVMEKFARGDYDEEVKAWLRTSESEIYRKVNKTAIEDVHGGNLDSFVSWMRLQFERNVPRIGNLREKMLEGKVTVADALLLPEDIRPTVPGVEVTPGELSVGNIWRASVNGFFKAFGSVPEDVLNRNPFYTGIYQAELKRQSGIARAQGVDIADPLVQESLMRGARRTALKTLEENLYTVKRYTNPAQQLKVATPFYMAQQNSARWWLGMAFKNPAVPYLGILGINSINKAFVVRDSDEYNKVAGPYSIPFNSGENVWVTVPKNITKILGVPSMEFLKVSKDSMNVWLQGEFVPMIQQFGPLVQYPVSQLFKALSGSKIDPDRELTRLGDFGKDIKSYVMPQGRPMTAEEILNAPRWVQSLNIFRNPSQSEEYWSAFDTLVKERQLQAWSEGKVLTNDDYNRILNESSKEARKMFLWEAVFRGGMPASTKWASDFELLRSEYFLYQERYGRVVGAAEFEKKYGTAKYVLASSSLSYNPGGVLSTPQTARNYELHKNLFKKTWLLAPEIAGQIINAGGVNDFSAVADEKIRSINVGGQQIKTRKADIAEEAQKREISVGWGEYIPKAEVLNAQMLAAGIRPGSTAAEPYEAEKRRLKAEIGAKYPAWARVNQDINPSRTAKRMEAIYSALTNTRFMNSAQGKTDLWQGLLEYGKVREQIRNTIKARDGGITSGSLDRVTNADLASALQYERIRIGSKYATFFDFAERYLDNDNLYYGLGN